MFLLLFACCTAHGCNKDLPEYYPYNDYFSTYSVASPYAGYSCYPGYACYGNYGGMGRYSGYGGFGGLDPNFTFGCHTSSGCAGYAPPSCVQPAHPECWSLPVLPPADMNPEELPKKEGTPDGTKPGPKPDAKPKAVSQQQWPGQALVLVQLPANAKLFLDDQPISVAGKSHRLILTPQLKAGSEYSYTLRAEVVSNGKTLSQTLHVSFEAGQQVQVHFDALGTGDVMQVSGAK